MDMGIASIATDLGSALINAGSVGLSNAQNMALQKEQWAREDTGIQRRVKDLIAAGLNPVLAAGSPSPTSITATMKPVVDAPSGIVSRALEARIAPLNMARTEADTMRVQSEALKAEYEAASARVQYQLDADKYKILSKRSDLLNKGDYQGLTLLEAQTLADTVNKTVVPSLTGTNLETQNFKLELLRKFGPTQAVMDIIGGGTGAVKDILK